MKKTVFEKTIRQLFDSALELHEFSCNKSKHCTFYRIISDEVIHIIIPDQGRNLEYYDIKVFPASPVFDPLFEKKFPDNLTVPTDIYSYMHPISGIGFDQYYFNSENEFKMRKEFENQIRSLLINIAIPYLNQFGSLDDIIPFVKNKLMKGIGLVHLGQKEQGFEILNNELNRLQSLNSSDITVVSYIEYIKKIIN
ncbi:MAG: hypothetical protein ACKVT2_08050 [Saprospiraceae bacterium]